MIHLSREGLSETKTKWRETEISLFISCQARAGATCHSSRMDFALETIITTWEKVRMRFPAFCSIEIFYFFIDVLLLRNICFFVVQIQKETNYIYYWFLEKVENEVYILKIFHVNCERIKQIIQRNVARFHGVTFRFIEVELKIERD